MAKEQGLIEWVPASIGFLCGIAFLLVLDSIIPHLHVKSNKPEGINTNNFLNRICNYDDIRYSTWIIG